MTADDEVLRAGHEQVVFCHDERTGLRAIVALYSTALGPGLGGTRFQPYPDEATALTDVLRLSEAMAYKNALAGLDHGGGKAVVIGDPVTDKSEALLRAYGRFVASLGGRYVTACDVGTYVADMDVVAKECRWVTGRSPADGGAGDSSVLTAFGVHEGMLAAAEHVWGEPSLAGRRVAVQGVGKVGRHLVDLLVGSGARVVVADVQHTAVERVLAAHPQVEVVDDPDHLLEADVDVLAPCALGSVLDDRTVPRLQARVVCGGANNQLAEPAVADALVARGITYCPDYVVNAGGVCQVADELHGFVFERARAQAARIRGTTASVLAAAAAEGCSPDAAALRLARRRIAEVGSDRPWLPAR
ncbi:Glu/Leu/Phe/Val dehydrogenase dimerization domain-containing protein [Aquipuribacter nitratireducens]|uniref:Glu/Leu/Phe/Val dehydrogenase dimerization domain-containing protein n=1 Tax=Aquipuribacter nitratireducens TaxID=650104 RepID=A0ABW0GNI3_9MICO